MNYQDEIIVKLVERGLSPTKVAAKELLDSFVGVIKDLAADGGVSINNLGVFKEITTPARTARNPITNAAVDVPAKVRLKFKASSVTTRLA